ncbi:MAG TPA: MFS transporter, partial [Candidatus Polarisedimenticolia bacterium]|nr:MFS transporter [Candidatus Polarisedimenticolia bacterium]
NAFRAIVSLAALSSDSSSRSLLVATAGAIFVLPYLLLSVHAGWLADRFSKRQVVVAAKGAELVVMLLALPALTSGSVPALLAVLFLLGSQSAIFSPAKLGAIPELLPEKDLSRANGLMELVTFLAIILGTVGGGALFTAFGGRSAISAGILIGLAVAGVAVSLGISKVPPSGERRPLPINIAAHVIADFRGIAGRRALFLAVLGVAWFWFLGMIFQLNVLVYARDFMGLGDRGVVTLNACVSIGIGLGAVIAGKLSGDIVELGLVPLGSIGMGLFAVVLGVSHPSFVTAGIMHGLLGVAAGFFIVPLDSYLQQRAKPGERGRIIGASNFLAFTGVILGSGWIALTGGLAGWSPATVVFATGLLSLVATVYILWLLPDFLVRLILWLLTHTIYRITARGASNIPKRGGALLVCNHISFVDALLVGACTQRFVRFLMYRPIYETRGLTWFFKLMGTIPVSEKDGRKGIAESLAAARERLVAGDLVCIFAEGSISRTGNLLRFRKGFEAIVKETGAPIIPIHLDGVWGSIFSYQGGRFLWKWPRRIPYPVTISIGAPMPASARAWQVRQAVMELSADAFAERKSRQKPLHVSFIHTARRFPRRPCLADSTGATLTFFGALAGALALSRRLARVDAGRAAEATNVGILLPPSVAGALVNVAVMIGGKVPVNLNYTSSAEALDSAIARCGIKTVISSKRFLEKVELPEREGMVMAEDLVSGIGAGAKLWFAVVAAVLPARLITALFVTRPRAGAAADPMDGLATIIFSSGSTATPKGI